MSLKAVKFAMRISALFRLMVCLCWLLGLGISKAQAFSRVRLPMGEYIHRSPLIVIADVTTSLTPNYTQKVTIQEVVRGEAKPGEVISLPITGTAHYIVPREAQKAAILFTTNWKNESSPVWEAYQKPEEIAALRQLVSIDDLPTERARLLALQKCLPQQGPIFNEQLVWDLSHMKQPKNFDLMGSSFGLLDEERQFDLLQKLGKINDARALPLLISSLDSPSKKVRWAASHALTFDFPGAPGVTEAFRRFIAQPENLEMAFSYVAKHDPVTAAKLPQRPPTEWQQAQQFLKDGDTQHARKALFALIEKEDKASWTSLSSAESLLPLLDKDGKERLRRIVVDYVSNTSDNYLYREQSLRLLRQLPHSDNLPVLIQALQIPANASAFTLENAARLATFALCDFGLAARQHAAQQVLATIKTRFVPGATLSGSEEAIYFCELAWLADDDTWQKAAAEVPAPWNGQLKELQSLHEAARSSQEANALVTWLPNASFGNAQSWAIVRLGELRHSVAIAPLFAQLTQNPYANREIETALQTIGGPDVEKGALRLLSSDQKELHYRGLNLLLVLQDEKIRPLLRQILSEKTWSIEDKAHAAQLLNQVGTPDDLPLLLPLTDFWTTEHTLQAQAMNAVTEIRDRFGYDVNGPIKPAKV